MKNSNSHFWKSIFRSPITLIVALICLFVFARAAWNIQNSAEIISTKLKESQAEADRLANEKIDLTNKIENLSTSAGVEAELRSKYKAVREGESVAVIVRTDTATDTNEAAVTKTGFWNKIMEFFGW